MSNAPAILTAAPTQREIARVSCHDQELVAGFGTGFGSAPP
jgi:hypothetical protein